RTRARVQSCSNFRKLALLPVSVLIQNPYQFPSEKQCRAECRCKHRWFAKFDPLIKCLSRRNSAPGSGRFKQSNQETRNAGKENLIFPQLSTINYQLFFGGIAQLVERQLCKLEVRGSNPLASKAWKAWRQD